jgi:hypothetical protein
MHVGMQLSHHDTDSVRFQPNNLDWIPVSHAKTLQWGAYVTRTPQRDDGAGRNVDSVSRSAHAKPLEAFSFRLSLIF